MNHLSVCDTIMKIGFKHVNLGIICYRIILGVQDKGLQERFLRDNDLDI